MKKKVIIIVSIVIIFLIILGIWCFLNRDIKEGDTLKYKKFKDNISKINIKPEIFEELDNNTIGILVKNSNTQKEYSILYFKEFINEKPTITVSISDTINDTKQIYWYSWENISEYNIPKGWSEYMEDEAKCIPISGSQIEAINGEVIFATEYTSVIRKFFEIF